MLYAQVNPEEQIRIAEARKRTKNISWYKRLQVIQLSSTGKSVTELSELFGQCQATLRD